MDIFTLLPLLSAVCVFAIGLFVFLKEKKSGIHFTFFLHAISITVWLFGTFMMFLSKGDKEYAIYWDRFVYIGVVFIPAFMYHFFLSYTKRKRDFLFYLGYLLSITFLILSRTKYFVDDLFVYKWGAHSKAQIFHHFFLLYFTIYVTIWFVKTYRHYKKLTSPLLKQQTKYIFIAFFVLIPVGSLGYLPAYGIPIFPFGYLGGVVFTVILAYAVLKHQLFNMKAIATEVLSASLFVVLFVQFILSNSPQSFFINGILVFGFAIFGILLIRGVLKEIETRERMEKLAKNLEIANTKLKALDKAKSDFVTIASHQLRSPITAIKGYASMVLEGSYGKIPEQAVGAIDRIFQSSNRLVFLINDFLNLSRIERGKMQYDFAEGDLAEMVKEIFSDYNVMLKKDNPKKLKLSLSIEPKKGYITKMDSDKIRQVISNLIDNAIKYNKDPEPGAKNNFVKVSLSRQKNNILFKVEDSGIGMDKETAGNLFQKFSRANNLSGPHSQGTGLGLYVAKEIMKAHDGKIWAESKGIDQGSSFLMELLAKK